MKAVVVKDQSAGTAGMTLTVRPDPYAGENDVIVEVHAAGFTWTELAWPSTWTDRRGRDRTPSIPGHDLAGVVSAVGYGTTGLTVGQRVFGITEWTRDGTLAEYTAVDARHLAPLHADVAFTVAASLPISGLTAWQGLFDHGRLQTGQSVLVHGAGGAVGRMATQLAREAGAYVVAPDALRIGRRRSTSAHTSSSTSRTTAWRMSAPLISCSTSSAERSRSGLRR
jgi:NADPH:quinone reductase-like Zn-dependent oxidoreductase